MSTHRQHRSRRRHHRGSHTFPLRHGNDLLTRRPQIPTTRCRHGKRRYFTRLDAEVVLAGLRRDPARREKRSYECPACHGWHLTSKTLEEYTAERYASQSAGLQTRPPITLVVPDQPTPMPSPADVAVQRKCDTAASVPPQQNSVLTRLREILRRAWRRLDGKDH